MKILKVIFAVAMMATMLTGSAAADKFERQLAKHPGYVDFGKLLDKYSKDAKVEVYLKEPLIKLGAKILKNDDPELYDIMRKLMLVRVQVFDIDSGLGAALQEVSEKTANKLEDDGWERIVKVRDDEEHVHVYLKPSDDYELIHGIVVMVIGEDNEAVFVNIVGDINPEDISKLGGHFDIDELDDIHVNPDVHKKGKSGGI